MKKAIIISLLLAIVPYSYGQIMEDECPKDAYYRVQNFVDSTLIGKKGHNKVEISQYVSEDDDSFVRLFFYSKGRYNKIRETNWWFCNEFIFGCYGMTLSLLPEISDFNNDGYNDFTYHSVEAARGGNDVRKLFIYNPETNKFVYIENSENYPNLSYNKELDCITSFAFYGCNATSFLKLAGDRLQRLAKVELCGDGTLTITEYDESGSEKSVRQMLKNEIDMFTPFVNYNPLKQ